MSAAAAAGHGVGSSVGSSAGSSANSSAGHLPGRLAGRAAIVTGAASGFGVAIAQAYAAAGAQVMVADLNDDAGRAVAQRIAGAYTHCDVADGEQVQALVRATVASFGRLDIVVNNAGTTHRNMPALEVDEAAFDRSERIRVCVVNPMIGETAMLEQFMGVPDTPDNRQRFLARIPLGRFTRPADVAAAALFLASDEAAYLTGTCLDVDGGRNI